MPSIHIPTRVVKPKINAIVKMNNQERQQRQRRRRKQNRKCLRNGGTASTITRLLIILVFQKLFLIQILLLLLAEQPLPQDICYTATAFQPKQQQQQQTSITQKRSSYYHNNNIRLPQKPGKNNAVSYYCEMMTLANQRKFGLMASSSSSSSLCLYLSSSLQQQRDGDDDDDKVLRSIQLQKEVESSKGMSNTKYLQKRFDLTDAWTKKASSAPGFTTMDRSTLIYRIDWLQDQLDLSDAQSGKILKRYPRITTYRPDTKLGPTMKFLKKKLAINTMELSKMVQQHPTILGLGIEEDQTLQRNINWMEKRLGLKKPRDKGKVVVRCPDLLCYSVGDNLDPSFQKLQDRLEISDKQTTKMCRDFPVSLTLNYTTNIEPTLDMLQERLDLNSTQLGTLCTGGPQILSFNATTNLEPKLDFLQERMNLNSTELGRFCLKAPRVLCYNYNTNIEPTLQWLQDRLHLSKNELRKIIKNQPTLLGLDPDNTFVPRLHWLAERLCLDDAAVKKMIIMRPQILIYAIEENMEPLLQWLEKTLSLDDDGIQTIMVKYPALFGYNITTNLEPTLDFYKMCIGEEEAIELVTKNPSYFGRSLERMQERYRQACEIGVAVTSRFMWRIAKQKKSDWDAFIKRLGKEKGGT